MAKNLELTEGSIDLSQKISDEVYQAAGVDIPAEKKSYEDLTPAEFFELVKLAKHSADNDQIRTQLEYAEKLLKKFKITKQEDAAKKAAFYIDTFMKELKLKELGIVTEFVYAMDVNKFASVTSSRHVVFDYLENYEREIPDDIVDKLEKLDGVFDRYIVMYTDYTQSSTKNKSAVKKKEAKVEKDPILFGIWGQFKDSGECMMASNRMYIIGDWVDEKCDLTLGKMIEEFKQNELEPESGDSIVHKVAEPDADYTEFSHHATSNDLNRTFSIQSDTESGD